MVPNQQPERSLSDHSSNLEIIAARDRTETALRALARIFSEEDYKIRLVQSVLESVGNDVHWHGSQMYYLLTTENVYNKLIEVRQAAEFDADLNPSPLDPNLLDGDQQPNRLNNLELVNNLSEIPGMANLYQKLELTEGEQVNLNEQQIEQLALEALTQAFTPPAELMAAAKEN